MSLIGLSLPGAAGQRHPATRMIIVQYSMTARWHSFSNCLGTRSRTAYSLRTARLRHSGHRSKRQPSCNSGDQRPPGTDCRGTDFDRWYPQTDYLGVVRPPQIELHERFANFKARKGGDHELGRIKSRHFDRDRQGTDFDRWYLQTDYLGVVRPLQIALHERLRKFPRQVPCSKVEGQSSQSVRKYA